MFLDEVDSIFGSRSFKDRSNNREITNQFMVEWDGIGGMDAGVLLLGATNRPFDLDEAILRRMPRRILFDLPKEDNRLEILRVHLKDEILDPTIDLANIAKRTQNYSGSDLRNICVFAAIQAVQKRASDLELLGTNDKLLPNAGRRILLPSYFDIALTEVMPTAYEDMDAIRELRRFTEQYGGSKPCQ